LFVVPFARRYMCCSGSQLALRFLSLERLTGKAQFVVPIYSWGVGKYQESAAVSLDLDLDLDLDPDRSGY